MSDAGAGLPAAPLGEAFYGEEGRGVNQGSAKSNARRPPEACKSIEPTANLLREPAAGCSLL